MKSPCDSQLLVKGTLHIPQQQRESVATSADVSESVPTNRAGSGEEERELSMTGWNFPPSKQVGLL